MNDNTRFLQKCNRNKFSHFTFFFKLQCETNISETYLCYYIALKRLFQIGFSNKNMFFFFNTPTNNMTAIAAEKK